MNAIVHSDGTCTLIHATNRPDVYRCDVLRALPTGSVRHMGETTDEDGMLMVLVDLRPASFAAVEAVPLAYSEAINVDTGWQKASPIMLGHVQPFGASLMLRRGRLAAAFRAERDRRWVARYMARRGGN